mgnify:CR=1 FL=1
MVKEPIVHGIDPDKELSHRCPAGLLWGFTMPRCLVKPMQYSGLDKLIFIASFMCFMQWGTRVTQEVINALY